MRSVTFARWDRRRRALARTTLALAAVLACLVPAWAQDLGDGVAELEVIAYGAQRFDLATGFTELSDGGEVVERGSGVRLVAPWLRYADGDRVEARDASVEGPFGTLQAPTFVLDLAAGWLRAEGGVVLAWQGGGASAEALELDVADGWVWLVGGVSGEAPALDAAEVAFEVDGGRIVLMPPYRFVDGPLVLSADAAGAPLVLHPDQDADGVVLGYDASTSLDDALRALLDRRAE